MAYVPEDAQMANKYATALNQQNKKYPLLINIEDGRLVPNVRLIGGGPEIRGQDGKVLARAVSPHPKYRVYMGDPKASVSERMRLLATQGIIQQLPVGAEVSVSDDVSGLPAAVHNDFADLAAFDIQRANPQELADYARRVYHHEFAEGTHHNTMRATLRAMAARAAGELG